ncbi:putative Superoxide dismutase copper/zinc binding domain-containing protein [Seiridium cardinale]|uniref:Superoxide dismutase copper/zinc binding domain-containing protein n=1 Tax=Seiridium cardinale TaxID=138064 RepID=A0ABR2XWE9_9PEZI
MSSPAKTDPLGPTKGISDTAKVGPSSNEQGHSQGLPMPGLSGKANGPVGNLLKGPVDANGKLKDAALMVGIKLDLEAEVHLTARVRGDILIGLY